MTIPAKLDLTKCAKRAQENAALSFTSPVHGSASEVNRSDADAQVVSCHRYLVVFRIFAEQLTVFYISELVRRRLLSSQSSTSSTLAMRWH